MLLSEKIANSSASELEKYTVMFSGPTKTQNEFDAGAHQRSLVSCRFAYPSAPEEGGRFQIKLSDVQHLLKTTGRLKDIYFNGLLKLPFKYVSFDFLNDDGNPLFAASIVDNDNQPQQPVSATVDIVTEDGSMFSGGKLFLNEDDIAAICRFPYFDGAPNGIPWASVLAMMLAVCTTIAIMNINGACELTPVVHDEKLQKARKKRSKPPLSNYTYINCLFNQGGSKRKSESGASVTRAAHTVRGHFKRCKNGVFWWKPHIAGSGTLKQRKAYVIKP